MAPNIKSSIAIVPSASQGPIAVGFVGGGGGPVEVSTALGCGEAEGATASRVAVMAGVDVGMALA
jgi:hypothetical protein